MYHCIRYLKSFFNKSNRNNAEIYLDENGTILTDQKTVANRFNKFYTNIAGNLLKNLGDSPTKFQDYLRNPNEHAVAYFWPKQTQEKLRKSYSNLIPLNLVIFMGLLLSW